MKNQIGIWIDKRFGYVVNLGKDKKVTTIESNLDTFNPKGGGRGKVVYGSVDTIKEKGYLARENKQKKAFFEELRTHINRPDNLYLFGPAQMKNELFKHLNKFPEFRTTSFKVEDADSMTENQIVAQVKDVFKVQ